MAPHQIEKPIVEPGILLFELLERADAVPTDLLDDPRGLRKLRCQQPEPLESVTKVEMTRPFRADVVKHRERGLVVTHLVERLAQQELRTLAIAGAVFRLACCHAFEAHRSGFVVLALKRTQRFGETLRRFAELDGCAALSGLLETEAHVLCTGRHGHRQAADQHRRRQKADPLHKALLRAEAWFSKFP